MGENNFRACEEVHQDGASYQRGDPGNEVGMSPSLGEVGAAKRKL